MLETPSTLLHTLLADALRTKVYLSSSISAELWCPTLHLLRGEVNQGLGTTSQQLLESCSH